MNDRDEVAIDGPVLGELEVGAGSLVRSLERLLVAYGGDEVTGRRRAARGFYLRCEQLVDLCRWLDFLDANLLEALDFQALCREQFDVAEAFYLKQPYDGSAFLGRFPAGSLILHGEANYYELERQAELLFGVVEGVVEGAVEVDDTAGNNPVSDEAFQHEVSPENARIFEELRRDLPSGLQRGLEAASRESFHRTRLSSLLFRIGAAGVVKEAREVLTRLGKRPGEHGAAAILDVLALRAGGHACGIEWGDRFDARILERARQVQGDDATMFSRAYELAHASFEAKLYVGGTHTLRRALDTRAFDCIRATDLVEALFRAAGGTDSVELRECRGGPSHTVVGRLVRKGNSWEVRSLDALRPRFEGARTWPDDFRKNGASFAVEVYRPGLDTAIWASGYVVCGAHAGTRVDAAIPFVAGHEERRQTRAAVEAPIYRLTAQ